MKKIKIKMLDRPEYIEDIKRIKKILKNNGYKISLKDAEYLWEKYSKSLCAEWINLPEKDEIVFYHIKNYIKGD